MPDRADRPRIGRRGNKKVRTGCKTCKIRKVKCDETKPQCNRCITSGRVCDGYPPVPPRARRPVPIRGEQNGFRNGTDSVYGSSDSSSSSGEHDSGQDFSSVALVSLSESGSETHLPSPGRVIGQNHNELYLFHRRTAPKLAGFMDNYFWNELVLQLGDLDPAIRHALSAVNSIYSYCEERGGGPQEAELSRLQHPAFSNAVQKYNSSIKALVHRKHTQGGDTSVALVCCVLFVCFEMLANERQRAMDHFDQGVKMLSQYTASTGTNPTDLLLRSDVVREILAPIFRRLSLQSIMLGRPRPLIPLFSQIYQAHEVRSSQSFRTLHEASKSLVAIMDDGLRLAHDVLGLDSFRSGAKYDKEKWMHACQGLQHRQTELVTDIEEWMRLFAPLEATCVTAPTDPKERLGALMLRLHHYIARIWVATLMSEEESEFDKLITQFAAVVHISSEIALLEKASFDPSFHTVFTFDMGVVAPLYFVCAKCRQRRIRRAGLHLLENWSRRESVWDPEQIACVAKNAMLLEDPEVFDEDASDDDWPPEWKRAHRIDFEFDKDEDGVYKTSALIHRKPFGLSGEWEVIRVVIPGAQIRDSPKMSHAGAFTSTQNSS